MSIIFGKVLSIFLIIGVGFLANKAGVLPDSSNKFLVDLLIMITSPCMILTSIASKELTDDTLGISLQIFLAAIIYFVVLSLLGYLLYGKILKFKPKEDIMIYTMILASMNCGFMGFPITLSLFGNDILYLMVLVNVIHTLYLYPFGTIQLNIGSSKGNSFNLKETLRAAANPCAIAAVIGIILLFTGIKLPEILFSSMEMIGDSTVPLSMLLVGVQLGNSNFSRIFRNRKLVATCLMKMFLVPVLVFLAVNWLPLASDLKVTLIFASCFASGVGIVPVISMENRNSLLAAEGVALTTLFSMVIIPAASMFLISWYGLS